MKFVLSSVFLLALSASPTDGRRLRESSSGEARRLAALDDYTFVGNGVCVDADGNDGYDYVFKQFIPPSFLLSDYTQAEADEKCAAVCSPSQIEAEFGNEALPKENLVGFISVLQQNAGANDDYLGCVCGFDKGYLDDAIVTAVNALSNTGEYIGANSAATNVLGGNADLLGAGPVVSSDPTSTQIPGGYSVKCYKTDYYYYPQWTTSPSGCMVGTNYPSWMAESGSKPSHLFNTINDCCSYHFNWYPAKDVCLLAGAPPPEPGYKLYPIWNGVDFCKNGTDYPAWMTYQVPGGKQYLFDDYAECCDEHFAWEPAKSTCLGASSSNAAAINGPFFYPDWSTSPSGCVNNTDYPDWMKNEVAGGLKYLFTNANDCCTAHFNWNKDICLNGAATTSGGASTTNPPKFFPDWSITPATCTNSSDYPSWMTNDVPGGVDYLFDDAASCCDAHFSWEGDVCDARATSGGTTGPTSARAVKFYPQWNTAPSGCKNDTDYPSWMEQSVNGGSQYLFDTITECCADHFQSSAGCLGTTSTSSGGGSTGVYYPLWSVSNCKLSTSTNPMPSWEQYTYSTPAACCDRWYKHKYQDCLNNV